MRNNTHSSSHMHSRHSHRRSPLAELLGVCVPYVAHCGHRSRAKVDSAPAQEERACIYPDGKPLRRPASPTRRSPGLNRGCTCRSSQPAPRGKGPAMATGWRTTVTQKFRVAGTAGLAARRRRTGELWQLQTQAEGSCACIRGRLATRAEGGRAGVPGAQRKTGAAPPWRSGTATAAPCQ